MEFRGFGFATTWLIHAALAAMIFFPDVTGCGERADAGPNLSEDKILIEAAIAYKKPEEKKQPQKKRRKRRAKKKVSASRDEKKRVDKKDKPKDEPEPSWEDFKRDTTEEPENLDLEEGDEAPKTGGSFDGKDHGWADENKGHPYMQEIARWMRFEIPTLEKGKGEAYACIRLSKKGRIVDTKVRKSKNTNINRAAEEALRRLEKKRNSDKKVKPVPSELRALTTKWICFKPTG